MPLDKNTLMLFHNDHKHSGFFGMFANLRKILIDMYKCNVIYQVLC